MKNYKNLNIKGVVLDRYQLENYLEKTASDHILQNNSDKDTYPIPNMKEDFEYLENMDNFKKRSIIYDVVIMYDLWFKDYGENKKDN